MKVLVVEDEPGILEPILALLRRERYQVQGAGNLEEAWEAFLEGEPEVLVLDVMLPEGEDAGFRFAETLRQGGFRGGILFLTARDALKDRVQGLELGGGRLPGKTLSPGGTFSPGPGIGPEKRRLQGAPVAEGTPGGGLGGPARLLHGEGGRPLPQGLRPLGTLGAKP